MHLDRPLLAQQIAGEVVTRFIKGHFRPLPTKIFPAARISDAFRHLSTGEHIGKVVVSMSDQKVAVIKRPTRGISWEDDGTHLITGGTRGFGLEVARWLARRGVRQLVLVSRSGLDRKTTRELEESGTHIFAPQVDIAKEQDVMGLIREVRENLPPLSGIFHSAAVLDDKLLRDLDKESLERVMAPKVAGAVYLHRHTSDLPLRYFICFSSVSSIIGNPGQGNYVVANGFLDAFAHYRRAHGYPCTTINWGVLAEIGIAARDKRLLQSIENLGISGFTTETALSLLQEIMEEDPIQIGAFDLDWIRWGESNQGAVLSPRFRQFTNPEGAEATVQEELKMTKLVRELIEIEPDKRIRHLESTFTEQLAVVLRTSADQIDPHQSINRLGVDSIIVLELRLALKAKWGLEITTLDLLQETSIASFAERQLHKLQPAIEGREAEVEESTAVSEEP